MSTNRMTMSRFIWLSYGDIFGAKQLNACESGIYSCREY